MANTATGGSAPYEFLPSRSLGNGLSYLFRGHFATLGAFLLCIAPMLVAILLGGLVGGVIGAILIIIAYYLGAVGIIAFKGAATFAAYNRMRGEPAEMLAGVQRALGRLPAILGIAALELILYILLMVAYGVVIWILGQIAGLLATLGALAMLVPLLWVVTSLTATACALVYEEKAPFDAFARSFELCGDFRQRLVALLFFSASMGTGMVFILFIIFLVGAAGTIAPVIGGMAAGFGSGNPFALIEAVDQLASLTGLIFLVLLIWAYSLSFILNKTVAAGAYFEMRLSKEGGQGNDAAADTFS